jgi:periplasmic protein TonB
VGLQSPGSPDGGSQSAADRFAAVMMTRALRLALCASAVIHLGMVASWRAPEQAASTLPVLVASLGAVPDREVAIPAAPAHPVIRERQHEIPQPKIRQPANAAPLMASTAPSAQLLPTGSGANLPVHDGPTPTSAPTAAPAPTAPASVELPRFDAAYLANQPPAYPSSARRRGIEGTTIVEARVGLAGDPRDVKLAVSAGDEALDRAAMEAVRTWRFVPARRGDQLIEASVRIPLVFRLN